MKKSILKVGQALSKADQKQIQGGDFPGIGDDPCFSTPLSICWANGCQVYSCPNGTDYCGPASPHITRC
jgi:hypothetical protein